MFPILAPIPKIVQAGGADHFMLLFPCFGFCRELNVQPCKYLKLWLTGTMMKESKLGFKPHADDGFTRNQYLAYPEPDGHAVIPVAEVEHPYCGSFKGESPADLEHIERLKIHQAG